MLAVHLCSVHNCADDGAVCTLEVVPEEEAWHYIQLSTHQAAVQLSMAVKFYSKFFSLLESDFIKVFDTQNFVFRYQFA